MLCEYDWPVQKISIIMGYCTYVNGSIGLRAIKILVCSAIACRLVIVIRYHVQPRITPAWELISYHMVSVVSSKYVLKFTADDILIFRFCVCHTPANEWWQGTCWLYMSVITLKYSFTIDPTVSRFLSDWIQSSTDAWLIWKLINMDFL